jgi:predicted nucleic-acid-binding protein
LVIGVDTNVVVRLLVEDDAAQTRKSKAIFQEHVVFLSETVILETAWVLQKIYAFTPETIVAGLKQLFGLPNVYLKDPDVLKFALEWYEDGLDFADAMHLAQASNCTKMVTFDQRFARRAKLVSDRVVTLLE